MKTVKINASKIDKTRLFEGKAGKWLDLVLIDKPDEYGNDGFVCQSCTKEERERGVRMPIIGSWKRIGSKKEQPKQALRQQQLPSAQASTQPPVEDDVPF